jgi:ribose 5-phosphate isomerase A
MNALDEKQQVALHAAKLVENGMLIGLGTGSTANYFIEELAWRHREEGLQVTAVASSVVSTIKAQALDLPLMSIAHLTRLDLYVDGADEVAPDMTLLKGRGTDLVREKLLAQASDKFLVLIDQSKLVDRIGASFPIPIEVMPFAWQLVKRKLEAIGGRGELRQNASKDRLAVTSYGSLVLDMIFPPELDSQALNQALNDIPGIVEHGIFYNLASAVFMVVGGQLEERWALQR